VESSSNGDSFFTWAFSTRRVEKVLLKVLSGGEGAVAGVLLVLGCVDAQDLVALVLEHYVKKGRTIPPGLQA
jgi:hypothetical protein